MTVYHVANTYIFIIFSVISQSLFNTIMKNCSILYYQRYEKNMVKKGKKKNGFWKAHFWIMKYLYIKIYSIKIGGKKYFFKEYKLKQFCNWHATEHDTTVPRLISQVI